MRLRHLALAAIGAAVLTTPAAGAQGSGDSDRWNWSGSVGDGNTVFVRNLNGPIRVEGTSGSTVEVVAYKVARRRGRTEDVKITVEQRSNRGDVVICAIWHERTRCDEAGYRSNSDRRWWDDRDRNRDGDVSVEFVVRLPRNVRVTVSSVNGGLEIDGVDSEVDANTVNGSIVARSNAGPVSARTVNGSLTIRTGSLGRETLNYSTVNGAISLEIPENANADVELRTVNGGISTDFPLTIEGRFSQRSVRGTIGRGGPLVRLSTTNGAIRLRRM